MIPDRYTLKNVKTAIRNPSLFRVEVRRGLLALNKRYHSVRASEPVDVMSEEWDNLIILDGCRFDLFEQRSHLSGRLESRTSAGSASEEFIEHNFVGGEFHDTVYVTANPFVEMIDDGTFFKLVNLLTEWDEEHQTVLPETVEARTKEVAAEYPHKRYIVHYMQPHHPFIGETGREMETRGWTTGGSERSTDAPHVWNVLRRPSKYPEYDHVNEDLAWEAYAENLDIVLESVERLLDSIGGRTVVTSDHGNLFGEWVGPLPTRAYGHPNGLHVPDLIKVPWLVIDDGERRHIEADKPMERERMDQRRVEERLRALGYAESDVGASREAQDVG